MASLVGLFGHLERRLGDALAFDLIADLFVPAAAYAQVGIRGRPGGVDTDGAVEGLAAEEVIVLRRKAA